MYSSPLSENSPRSPSRHVAYDDDPSYGERRVAAMARRYDSSPEPDPLNFEAHKLTFFQAHRPFKLDVGERVQVLRRISASHGANIANTFTLDVTDGNSPRFEFVSGIVDGVAERLITGEIARPVVPGQKVTVTFDARCQQGNRVHIDEAQNNIVSLSRCQSGNDGDVDVKWICGDVQSFEFQARDYVDLNEQDIRSLLEANEVVAATSSDLLTLRQLLKKSKDVADAHADADADADADAGWKFEHYNEKLIDRATDLRLDLTPRSILLLVVDDDACTVAYDDDEGRQGNQQLLPHVYHDTYQFHTDLPHIHLRSEITPTPIPSTSLGEVAAQFHHGIDDADPSMADHLARLPTYGRILVKDAANIVAQCDMDAHASANVGMTSVETYHVERRRRLNEIAMASGIHVNGKSSVVHNIEVDNERASQSVLDTRALEYVARNDMGHGNDDNLADKMKLLLPFLLWAEYPLPMLRALYAGSSQSSMSPTVSTARTSTLVASLNTLWSAYTSVTGVASSIISFFNCYRRESSAPLWLDRLHSTVPRPVRLAPAGAQVRCSSWHPVRHRLAIGTSDGCVFVHIPQLDDEEDGSDNDVSGWLPFKLRHQFQREIHCMEWQPLSGTGLAVGCATGICYWRLVENGSATDQTASTSTSAVHGGHAWCEVLVAEGMGHVPVNGISWSPDGRRLASASVCSDHVMVWDVALGTATPVLCVRGVGTSNVMWAPTGHYLFASTLSKVVRVWETKEWTGERWTIPTGPCQDACWNPTGTLLLCAVAGSSELWTFAFHHKPPEIRGVLADLRLNVGHVFGEHVVDSEDDEFEEGVEGGKSTNLRQFCIREVAWSKDAFGQRLAVTVNVRGSHLTKRGVDEMAKKDEKLKRKKQKEKEKEEKKKEKKRKKEMEKKNKNKNKKSKDNDKNRNKKVHNDKGEEAAKIKDGGPVTKQNQHQGKEKEKEKEESTNSDVETAEEAAAGGEGTLKGEDDGGNQATQHSAFGPRDGEEFILIYSVQIQPSLRFTPRGFLRGPIDGVKPYNIEFWPACDTGALLSACWLNGEVTLHPLVYDVKRHEYNGASLMGRDEDDNDGVLIDEYDDDLAMDLERRDVHNQRRQYGRDW